MLIHETTSRAHWISMQAVEPLARFFGFRQTTTLGLVVCRRGMLELLEQLSLALGVKENL
jgi:hypothetical protein